MNNNVSGNLRIIYQPLIFMFFFFSIFQVSKIKFQKISQTPSFTFSPC